MVVESAGNTGNRQAGQGAELGGSVSWEEGPQQLYLLPHWPKEPWNHPRHQARLTSSPLWIAQ